LVKPFYLTSLLILIGATELLGATRSGRVVRVWCHQGQAAENKAMQEIVASFNRRYRDEQVQVEITFFPDFQFTEKIAIAAAARDLPDVFDIDGPLVARYVQAGLLQTLEQALGPEDRADFLPSILAQGTIDGKLYALGAFDSAVVLYYDRQMFAQAGVVPPNEGAEWGWDEFLAAARRLRAKGFEPLSLHMDESADEWYTYAFSPVIWGGGGSLISPDGNRVAGILSSEANVRSLTHWQQLFREKFASASPVDPNPFDHNLVAMDWSGHWLARPHVAAKGKNLGVMSLPVGRGQPFAPCGSWCWGVSSRATDPEAAFLWLRWATATDTGILPIVRANGAIPARRSAFAAFPEYQESPYNLFRRQLETQAHPRPHTPDYAALTKGFAAALRDIAHGADVAERLRMAEHEIQAVIDRRRESRVTKNAARPVRSLVDTTAGPQTPLPSR
jgi:ABC-type glycerol-3-phosphate transport system substrate-binding protein